MQKQIYVSIVVTVYNKEESLPATIASLRNQLPERRVEYIFIDDCSTDNSVAVLEQQLRYVPNKIIITNHCNQGPSIRLNQAVAVAQGKFIYIIDGDDIAPQGLLAVQQALLEQYKADFIYGKTLRLREPVETLLSRKVNSHTAVEVIDNPLDFVARHNLVRTSLMVRRNLFARAGGCDARVFIQDISLPLRLALHAKRMLFWHEHTLIVPRQGGGHLSENKHQQHHDQFFSYRFCLENIPPGKVDVRRRLFGKMISACWKHTRAIRPLPYISMDFLRYLYVKLARPAPIRQWIENKAFYFRQIEGIRRCEE